MTIDKVNSVICDKLYYLTYSQFLDAMEKVKHLGETDETGGNIWSENQFKKIKKMVVEFKNQKYSISQKYKYGRNRTNGRKFVDGLGLQNINRYIRGLLCDGLYFDFDMKNCHPNLLRKLCNINNVDCPYLSKYCSDRDNIIKKILKDNDFLTKSQVKTDLFITSINYEKNITTAKDFKNCKGKRKPIKSEFFEKFDEEMKNIQEKFTEIYNQELKFIKKELGKYNNSKGCLMSHLLCNYEADIIEKIKQSDITSLDVLMFDGFMTLFTNINENEIIKKLNELTKDDYIQWDTKPHDTQLKDFIMKIENKERSHFYEDSIADLSKTIYNQNYKKCLLRYGSTYYYKKAGIWICDQKAITINITKWIMDQDIAYKDSNGNDVIVNKRAGVIRDLTKLIMDYTEESEEDIEIIADKNSKGKLVFKNGYYDFDKKQFIKNFENLDSFIKIPKNLNMEWDEEINNQIMSKIFLPIFGVNDKEKDCERFKLMEYFLQRLARQIAGKVEDKNFTIMRGPRNCGKGVIEKLNKNSFSRYITSIKLDNFMEKKVSGDSAKLDSWILDCRYSRLAIAEECKIDDKESIDGAKIKGFCSGGDTMVARKNFKDEKEFTIQCGLMICVNDMLPINPVDTMQTCDDFNMTSKFIRDDESLTKLSNLNYYKADQDIKNIFCNDEKVINQYILLLISYFYKSRLSYPKSIKDSENLINDDDLDENSKIKNLFIENDNNFLSNNDLESYIKKKKLGMSIRRLKPILKGLFPDCDIKYRHGNYRICGVKGLLIKEDELDVI
jgi:hypothetical protein